MYMALYEPRQVLHIKAKTIFSKPVNEVLEVLQDQQLTDARVQNASLMPRNAKDHLLQILTDEDFIEQLKTWEAEKCSNAMFKSITNYLQCVQTILFFVEAPRNSDLVLHLQTKEPLSKLFFALDRIKYKRLWPRYIADIQEVKTSHPENWHELHDGNISVMKSEIPFISIGAHHACEQLNRMMKIHSG